MEELTDIFGDFSLSSEKNDYVNYSYFDFYKNPNKLPINNVYLEQSRVELDISNSEIWQEVPKKQNKQTKIRKKEVIPALHESWIPEHVVTFEYQPYNFNVPEEENTWFIENNRNYILFLEHLIKCTYHQFWCTVLFKEEVQNSLRDFLLDPIPLYLYRELGTDFQKTYKRLFNAFYMVLRRLVFFKQSEIEYMPKSLGAKYLLERKLLNLPIATTISLLYKDFDAELIDELAEIYFKCEGQEKIIQKEIEYILKHSIVVLEMIRGKITGNLDPSMKIVPISIEERPKLFDMNWIDSVVNYLLNTISSLGALLRLGKSTVSVAYSMKIPEKLAKHYDLIFTELYDLLEGREELKEACDLAVKILYKIGLARSKFVETFHSCIAYLLDEIISKQQTPKDQLEFVETFINSMAAALEYEVFICDYNFKHDVPQTIDILQDFSNIDKTRVEYILTSLNNLERREFLKEKFSFESAFSNYLPKAEPVEPVYMDEAAAVFNHADDIEVKINSILGIFPHLGDGFVEKCLEHYDNDADQVIQAVLESNLPPHILNIPMDLPRIPPEPEPPKPVLAYCGKRPDYDDALKLLNDRKEKDKMKTLILEGIKYNNRYDNSDDEYDDTLDDIGKDFVVEHDIEKYEKPNEEDLVSDTSYSDNEFDDEGRRVETTTTGFKPFCEDPAVVRARYEARFGARRGRSNVVGAPKGQGQEKKVLQARQKKNVQKSTRANHNRKGGSQFKRNRGMVPS